MTKIKTPKQVQKDMEYLLDRQIVRNMLTVKYNPRSSVTIISNGILMFGSTLRAISKYCTREGLVYYGSVEFDGTDHHPAITIYNQNK